MTNLRKGWRGSLKSPERGVYVQGDTDNIANVRKGGNSAFKQKPYNGWDGILRFFGRHIPAADAYDTSNPTWYNTHFDAMMTHSTYFYVNNNYDDTGPTYRNGFIYLDFYGIHAETHSDGLDAWVTSNPEWVMKLAGYAADTTKVNPGIDDRLLYGAYVDYGSYDQYAADIFNPAFRAAWIARAVSYFRLGTMRGIWIDDVNMKITGKISDYIGTNKTDDEIYSPYLGTTFTVEEWMQGVVDFMTEVRAALNPLGCKILINTVFNDCFHDGANSSYVDDLVDQIDYWHYEHGFADTGIGAGSDADTWSFKRLRNHVAYIHGRGKNVVIVKQKYGRQNTIHGSSAADTTVVQTSAEAWCLYNAGCYYVFGNEGDYCGDQTDDQLPDYWCGGANGKVDGTYIYDLNLGPPESTYTQPVTGQYVRLFKNYTVTVYSPDYTVDTNLKWTATIVAR